MYSKQFKNKILEMCFEECSNSFTKDTSGIAIVPNVFIHPKGILSEDKKRFFVKKGTKIGVKCNYSGQVDKTRISIHIVKKLEQIYRFVVLFENEELVIECDQYEIE